MSNSGPDYYRQKLLTTLEEVAFLSNACREAANAGKSVGSVEIRVVKFVPTYCLKIFDQHLDRGLAGVELYPHKTSEPGPRFLLTRKSDGKWFNYFCSQFEIAWSSSRALPSSSTA